MCTLSTRAKAAPTASRSPTAKLDTLTRLDDRPSEGRTNTIVPLGYTADGRKLLALDTRTDGASIVVSYPCREPGCVYGETRYSRLLELTLDDIEPGYLPVVTLAPDSGGVAIELRGGLYYFALGPNAPGKARRLWTGSVHSSAFIAGGRPLLAHTSEPPVAGEQTIRSRARVFDLAATPELTGGIVLQTSAPPTYSTISSELAPDGEHFLVVLSTSGGDPQSHAFRSADVLSGNVMGRALALPVHGGVLHLSNTRIVTRVENAAQRAPGC